MPLAYLRGVSYAKIGLMTVAGEERSGFSTKGGVAAYSKLLNAVLAKGF